MDDVVSDFAFLLTVADPYEIFTHFPTSFRSIQHYNIFYVKNQDNEADRSTKDVPRGTSLSYI